MSAVQVPTQRRGLDERSIGGRKQVVSMDLFAGLLSSYQSTRLRETCHTCLGVSIPNRTHMVVSLDRLCHHGDNRILISWLIGPQPVTVHHVCKRPDLIPILWTSLVRFSLVSACSPFI
jgi:hypothetical protein